MLMHQPGQEWLNRIVKGSVGEIMRFQAWNKNQIAFLQVQPLKTLQACKGQTAGTRFFRDAGIGGGEYQPYRRAKIRSLVKNVGRPAHVQQMNAWRDNENRSD